MKTWKTTRAPAAPVLSPCRHSQAWTTLPPAPNASARDSDRALPPSVANPAPPEHQTSATSVILPNTTAPPPDSTASLPSPPPTAIRSAPQFPASRAIRCPRAPPGRQSQTLFLFPKPSPPSRPPPYPAAVNPAGSAHSLAANTNPQLHHRFQDFSVSGSVCLCRSCRHPESPGSASCAPRSRPESCVIRLPHPVPWSAFPRAPLIATNTPASPTNS